MNIPGREDDGCRPDSGAPHAATHCLYCKQPLGIGTHLVDCVTQRKTVVVEMKVLMVVTVPQSDTSKDVESFLNDSSHCSSNEIGQLYRESIRNPGACNTCHRTDFKFVREATEEDHVFLAWNSEAAQ